MHKRNTHSTTQEEETAGCSAYCGVCKEDEEVGTAVLQKCCLHSCEDRDLVGKHVENTCLTDFAGQRIEKTCLTNSVGRALKGSAKDF